MQTRTDTRAFLSAGFAAVMMGVTPALAGSSPDYGMDFVKVGDPGNAGYPNLWGVDNFKPTVGGVDYEYRIMRTEVSTADWLEFTNAFAEVSGAPDFGFGMIWGARPIAFTPFYELRPDVPNAGKVPLFSISWHRAAMYVNWLNNDKRPTLDAISDGAYDISTFGYNEGTGEFTDQLTHHPDAKYWIPTFDELLKASHYDPNKSGVGEGGWWEYVNGSDVGPVPGLPGEGETSTGLSPSDISWSVIQTIPLESYPQTQSPWGLLDLSGGGLEWTEGHLDHSSRFLDGSYAGQELRFRGDALMYPSTFGPTFQGKTSFRIASVVPTIGTVWLGLVCGMPILRRRR